MSVSRRNPTFARRGAAVLVVLALVAVSLAVSFALLRTQTASQLVQSNGGRLEQARQAAVVGMTVALRRMHQSNWSGVGGVLTGSISGSDSYSVTFTAGDASLTASDPNYAKTAYRVTLVSTGVSTDLTVSPARSSTHRVEAVVELVPRALAARSSTWTSMLSHTVCQISSGNVEINGPGRIEGSLWLQSGIQLLNDLSMSGTVRQSYLGDLGALATAGVRDWRPVSGPIRAPLSSTDSTTRALLTTSLGVAWTDASSQTLVSTSWPGSYDTYKLYPGGKSYTVPRLGSELQAVTLQPDPLTNPLGLYYVDGDVTLKDDVMLSGTLIARGRVKVLGKRISLASAPQPNLRDATQPVHVQTLFTADDLRIEPECNASIAGLAVVGDEFDGTSGTVNTDFTLEGKLLTQDLLLRGRSEWTSVGGGGWDSYRAAFLGQTGSPIETSFSQFLSKNYGLSSQPRIRVKPHNEDRRYQFFNRNDTLYAPHAEDPGLRWDVIRWKDNA